MHHWHIRLLLSSLFMTLTVPANGLPRIIKKLNATIPHMRKGLSIPAAPPPNMYRDEISTAFGDKNSLLSRFQSFHNPTILSALRQTEWLRHLTLTQKLTPGMWDAIGFNFAEGAAEHFKDRLYPVDPVEAPTLHAKVGEYATKLNIPMPMIFLLDDAKMFNAYATGLRHRSGFMVIGKGLLDATSTEQVNGVIAHELGHLYHHHVTKTMILPFASAFSILTLVGICSLIAHKKKVSKEKIGGYAVSGMLASIIAYPLIQNWYSRLCERQADAVAGKINPQEGLAAIQAIAAYENKLFADEIEHAQELVEHRYEKHNSDTTQSYISSLTSLKEHYAKQQKPSFLKKLFSSHPDTNARLEYFEELVDQEDLKE